MSNYYKLEDKDHIPTKVDNSEAGEQLTRLEYLNKLARGEISDEEDEIDDKIDILQDDEDDLVDDDDHNEEYIDTLEEAESDDITEEATLRLAVLNCNWDKIKAADLQ